MRHALPTQPVRLMRRALTLLVVLAALAIAAAGCGGKSSSSPLDDALGYMPRNSLAIVAIKTNFDDKQYKDLGALIDKFPFASSIKARVKQSLKVGGGKISYESDIKPLLGNDLVVAVPPGRVPGQSGRGYVLAWHTAGGDPQKLISKSARKVGSESGATLYQNPDGSVDALKGDTIVAAKTRPLLDAAIQARNAPGRMSEDSFKSALAGLNQDAIVRVTGDFQRILASSPRSAKALKVPWVRSLRTFGGTASADPDGLSFDFRAKTEGVSASQLPLATGSASPPVVKRPGEVGIGIRNPAQIVRFVEQVAGITDPKSLLGKNRISKQLGVDLDRDVVAQLGGDSAGSFGVDGGAAVRADLKDAGAFRKTLATIMKNLPKAQRAQGKPASTVKSGPKGLYIVTKPTGKATIVGVIGNQLVIATDVPRAQEFAAQPGNPVAGLSGAVAISADPKSLVNAALKKRGNAGAALIIGPALSAHLESLDGSVDSETDGLRGHLKLTIR